MADLLKGFYVRYLDKIAKLDCVLFCMCAVGMFVVFSAILVSSLYVGQFSYHWFASNIDEFSFAQNYALSIMIGIYGAVISVMCYLNIVIALFHYKKIYKSVVNWFRSTTEYSTKR